MQKDFRKWTNWAVAFLLCFSLVVNIHCVLLLFRYRQIYQATPVFVSESGTIVSSDSTVLVPATDEDAAALESNGMVDAIETESQGDTEALTSEETMAETETEMPESMVGSTVYVTKSGTKFHRDGCSSLSKSKIPISYDDAISRGFEPCGRCKP
ncbi:MAG: hypothetical protein IKW04_06730 [Clostridia bacterium]|nr:hypothetical protein [Clostridia bacterium]